MSLDALDTICLTLAANNNEIEGRTVIQKLIYFEMQKIKEINIMPHLAYYYGPFNSEVADGLGMLVYLGIITERIVPETYPTWAYRVEGDKGKSVIEKLKRDKQNTYKKIKDVVQICKDCCSLKQNPLSIAAKIHYIFLDVETKNMLYKDISDATENFGWEITDDEVDSGAQLLEQLDLARIKR